MKLVIPYLAALTAVIASPAQAVQSFQDPGRDSPRAQYANPAGQYQGNIGNPMGHYGTQRIEVQAGTRSRVELEGIPQGYQGCSPVPWITYSDGGLTITSRSSQRGSHSVPLSIQEAGASCDTPTEQGTRMLEILVK